ncbi:hypothetical protein [Leptolyngbya sp. O-77]|uniref:hypothetical protein n=1 Tax=Leptolyngbya sp. O-77 TaxID=1080068 RepID=UPI000B28DC0B|nr:hypothetical protein [Leptolyngbya sp. O-77]
MQRGVSLRDRPSSPSTRTVGRSPSSPSTDIFGQSPPDTFRNLELLTQIYRDLKFATYSTVFESVRFDPDLEEPSLCKWGANRPLTRKLTEPER